MSERQRLAGIANMIRFSAIMSDENKFRDAADAVTGLAEAVPIYQDVVQPAAKEFGVALQTVASAVHVALAPVSELTEGRWKRLRRPFFFAKWCP